MTTEGTTDGTTEGTTEARRPLFRPEAVAHHARGITERRTLDLGERRTSWTFRVILLLVVGALVAAFTVNADESAKGTATVSGDGRAAALVLPIGAVGRLAIGQPVRVSVDGREVPGRVATVGAPVTEGDFAVVPATATLDAPLPAGARGDAVVRIGRRSLAKLFLGWRE